MQPSRVLPHSSRCQAHSSSVFDSAYLVAQKGSFFLEDAVGSAVKVVWTPGKNEDDCAASSKTYWLGRTILTALFALPLLPLPIARSLMDRCRPDISFVQSGVLASCVGAAKTIHLMTINTALGPEWLNAISYLNSSVLRAREIANKLISQRGSNLPHVFLAQEVWDESATRVLVEALKTNYPHILHSIGPRQLGRNSGLFLASFYPIIEAEFRPFPAGCLEFSNKGVVRAVLQVGDKKVAVYNLHNVSPETPKAACLREQHLATVLDWIKGDHSRFSDTFIAGDFNISRLNNFRKPMREYPNIQETFFRHFHDPFQTEHEEEVRVRGTSRYLEVDVPGAIGREPQGSFYSAVDPNWRFPPHTGEIPGCRYDYILRYQREGAAAGTAEIRRIFEKNTDHLAVSAEFSL